MAKPDVTIPIWALSVALFCALFLIYASSFTMDYLTLDEVGHIGVDAGWSDYYYYALAHGRPLCFFRPLVYMFVEYDPVKIQLVRFLSFVAMAGIAVLLFRFLRRETDKPFFAFFTTLLLFSQLPFQAISAFSLDLIAFYLQPMLWSLAAFWCHFYFFPKRSTPNWKAYGVVGLLLLAGMQAGQTWAFFGMVPMSYLVLTGGRERLRQAVVFIVLAVVVTALSVVTYKIGLAILHAEDRIGYGVGEATMKSMFSSPMDLVLSAVNPLTYWSAFKLWNYPYPFHNTPANGNLRQGLAFFVMIAWALLVLGAMTMELRAKPNERGAVIGKWLAAGFCVAFGALVMLADSTTVLLSDIPDKKHECRPHLTMVMAGVCIFTSAYALLSLSSHLKILQTKTARAAGVVLVLMTAFGAQSGLLKSYVDNRGDQLDFIRTELCSRSPDEFDRIVVLFAPSATLCVCEPCDRYSGRVTHLFWHARRPERYKYVMNSIGIPPESKEFFFDEKKEFSEPLERDLVIDWRKYHAARQRYAQGLRGK